MTEHHLAVLLHKTKRELRRDLGGTRELAQWIAYLDEHDPLDKFWHMAAMICVAIYRAAGYKGVNIKQFLPQKPLPPIKSAEALKERFMAVIPPSAQKESDHGDSGNGHDKTRRRQRHADSRAKQGKPSR